jgi:hypothetical protein
MALAAPAGKPLPASPDDIAAAVGDCWNAVSLGSVDRAQLEARGWTAGTPAARNGRPVVGVPSLHGKAGSNAIIMLVDAPELRSICTVIGVVASTEDIGKAAGAVQRTLLAVDPKVKAARSENSIVFLSLPRIAMLEPTGTKDRPATRISVAYKAAESK